MNYINISANRNDPEVVDFLPFRCLGNYIADKEHDHAKVDCFWAVNCVSGDSLDVLAEINDEIEWIQAQNTTVETRKTLHVSLSLPEGESLTHEQWKDAESMLAKALGLEEHQRVVALHNDTKHHQHLNIGYNLIHPNKFTKNFTENDFKNGSDVCRLIEKKYGLKRDVGFREAKYKDARSAGVKNMEAHTWHQSFESFVLEQKKPLLDALTKAKNWQDVHQAFAEHDLKLKKRANGLVIAQGKQHMKASILDRSCSKNALEKRFGQFEPMRRSKAKPRHSPKKYGLKPHFPLRGKRQSALWQKFMGIRQKDKPFMTWRDFLMLEAGHDMLALALIKAYRGLLGSMSASMKHAYLKRKAVPVRKDFSQAVSELLIHRLTDTAPWQQPSSIGRIRQSPFNPASDEIFSGLNRLILDMAGRDDPRWMTRKQAEEAGCRIAKGEVATQIEYCQYHEQRPLLDRDGQAVLDGEGNPITEYVKRETPKVVYIDLFNAEQVEDIEPYEPQAEQFDDQERLDRAKAIVDSVTIDIREDQAGHASYDRQSDCIHLPKQKQFLSPEAYYATAIEQLAYATGHEDRLQRTAPKDDHAIDSMSEQLRAEIASFMLNADLGLGHEPNANNANIDTLIKHLQHEPKAAVDLLRDAAFIQAYLEQPDGRDSKEHSAMLQQQQDEAAKRANMIYGIAEAAQADHTYLKIKDIPVYGLKQTKNGALVVPMRTIDGELRSLQFIGGDGNKAFIKGGQRSDLMHLIDPQAEITQGKAKQILIAIDYESGAALHQLTGKPVAVVFNNNHLPTAAQAIRNKNPEASIVIAADLTNKPHALSKLHNTAKQIDAEIAMPRFNEAEAKQRMKSWYDLAASRHKAIAPQISKVLSSLTQTKTAPSQEL